MTAVDPSRAPLPPRAIQVALIGGVIVLVALIVLGHDFNPSRTFVDLGILLGLPSVIVLTLRIQPTLVGCRYRLRGGGFRVYTPGVALWVAFMVAALSFAAAWCTFGVAGNRVIGHRDAALYTVSGKATYSRGRSGVCFSLSMYEQAHPLHIVRLCTSQSFQEQTPFGATLRLREVRSWFGDQVMSYQRVFVTH